MTLLGKFLSTITTTTPHESNFLSWKYNRIPAGTDSSCHNLEGPKCTADGTLQIEPCDVATFQAPNLPTSGEFTHQTSRRREVSGNKELPNYSTSSSYQTSRRRDNLSTKRAAGGTLQITKNFPLAGNFQTYRRRENSPTKPPVNGTFQPPNAL